MATILRMLQAAKERLLELSTKALAWGLLAFIAFVGFVTFFRPSQFEEPPSEPEAVKIEKKEFPQIP